MKTPIQVFLDGCLVLLYRPIKQTEVEGRIIYYCEGDWCEKDENGEYYPDWSLTWFFEDREHPENYLYMEQDPPETALRNLRTILTGGRK